MLSNSKRISLILILMILFAEKLNRIIQSSSGFYTFSLIKADSTIYLIDCKGLYQMETDNNSSNGLNSYEYKQRYSDLGAPVDYARIDVPSVFQIGTTQGIKL